jgi:hypothetical protein
MPYEDEPTQEHRAIGRARAPQPKPPAASAEDGAEAAEPGWNEPPVPVDAPIPQETTTRLHKLRNQRR